MDWTLAGAGVEPEAEVEVSGVEAAANILFHISDLSFLLGISLQRGGRVVFGAMSKGGAASVERVRLRATESGSVASRARIATEILVCAHMCIMFAHG